MKMIRVQDEPVVATPLPPISAWADYACVMVQYNLGGEVGSEQYVVSSPGSPDYMYLDLINQVNADPSKHFEVAEGGIILPTPGKWAWHIQFYWWNYPDIIVDDLSRAAGEFRARLDSGIDQCNVSIPFVTVGNTPNARYSFLNGIIDVGENTNVSIETGPQYYTSTTYTITGSTQSTWDAYMWFVRLSDKPTGSIGT